MSNDKNEVILFLLSTQLIDPCWESMFMLACLIKEDMKRIQGPNSSQV